MRNKVAKDAVMIMMLDLCFLEQSCRNTSSLANYNQFLKIHIPTDLLPQVRQFVNFCIRQARPESCNCVMDTFTKLTGEIFATNICKILGVILELPLWHGVRYAFLGKIYSETSWKTSNYTAIA